MAGMLPGVECARRRRFHQGGSLDPQHWGCHRRTRRSSFCLYQSEYIQQPQLHSTTRSALQPGRTDQQQQSHDDCKLQDAAREARERLDERLRTTSLPSNRRRGSFWCRNSSKQTCDSDPRGGNCQEEVWPSSIRGWFSSAASVNGARRSAAESIKHDVLKQTSSLGVSKASIDLLHREAFTSANKDSGKYSWKSLNVKNSQQGECPVCLEPFQMDHVLIHLPCTHKFHSKCLIPWLNSHCHCPCCRTEISIKAP
ncbi:probable E3 ubiquitin-protein ligase RHY1A [Cryptomeria japonica]|uniref:probable E3 ubiquitin-protein ligase RHY1A n=1 Tax=Cryptomeria japonica TaxID=3369 RepID=UPI0027DA27CF|nr:probable E3 ubiquitin-protein ligase RHY1A [Cryptomeria japonica]XP_057871513.2 probable E3 ubiquitin-protein ligase RHY1A [Cryptomeria japonica]